MDLALSTHDTVQLLATCPHDKHLRTYSHPEFLEHAEPSPWDGGCPGPHPVHRTLPLVEVTQTPAAEYVTVHEVDRHYGGPEEGGWYYDAGTVVLTRAVLPHQTWEQVCDDLERTFDIHTGHRFSVRPRGRDYRLEVGAAPGTCFPEQRPTYS